MGGSGWTCSARNNEASCSSRWRSSTAAVQQSGAAPEARPPRARWQERDHRHGRRRPRARSRRDRLVCIRHVGSTVHRRKPCRAGREGLRRARLAPGRAGRAYAPWKRPRSGHGHRTGHQRRRTREDPLVHPDRCRRGRESSFTGGGRDRGRARPRLLLSADDLWARSSPGCASPRKRSFGTTTALIRASDVHEAIRVRTGSSTVFRRRSSRATSTGRSGLCATSAPESRT